MASIKDEIKQAIAGLTETELAHLYVQARQEAKDKKQAEGQRRQGVAEDMKRIRPK